MAQDEFPVRSLGLLVYTISEMNWVLASTLFLAGASSSQERPHVEMRIEGRGSMTIELYAADAPKTVNQFITLVRRNFYDGVRFHRVENFPRPFLIQTGDPLSKTLDLSDPRIGTGGSGTKVPFERNNIQFLNGTLGLVRDLKDPNSGDSQFFICNGNQRFLEGTYVAFGRVIKGLDLIAKVQLGERVVSIREVKP